MAFIPLDNIISQIVDSSGDPAASFTLESFVAGTSTPTNLFTTNAGGGGAISFTFDSEGYISASGSPVGLFRDDSVDLKLVLKNASAATVWTFDNVDSPANVISSSLKTSSAGTEALPALILGDGTNQDINTGWYHSNTDEWSASANGAKVLTYGVNGLDVVKKITASTLNADGDVTAGDNAAIGFTASEGIVITGQGTTTDVMIKNDAKVKVLSIRTGTTDIDLEGTQFFKEQAAASGDVSDYGQFWVQTVTPNIAKFTNDAGGDFALQNLVIQSEETSNFNAVAGRLYPCDTNGGAFTMTLPSSPTIGDVVGVIDANGTFGDNNLTLGRNGSSVFRSAEDGALDINNWTTALIFLDATNGWLAHGQG